MSQDPSEGSEASLRGILVAIGITVILFTLALLFRRSYPKDVADTTGGEQVIILESPSDGGLDEGIEGEDGDESEGESEAEDLGKDESTQLELPYDPLFVVPLDNAQDAQIVLASAPKIRPGGRSDSCVAPVDLTPMVNLLVGFADRSGSGGRVAIYVGFFGLNPNPDDIEDGLMNAAREVAQWGDCYCGQVPRPGGSIEPEGIPAFYQYDVLKDLNPDPIRNCNYASPLLCPPFAPGF